MGAEHAVHHNLQRERCQQEEWRREQLEDEDGGDGEPEGTGLAQDPPGELAIAIARTTTAHRAPSVVRAITALTRVPSRTVSTPAPAPHRTTPITPSGFPPPLTTPAPP